MGTDQAMPLTSHLEDLRSRIIRSLLFILAGFAACYFFREPLFELLKVPMNSRLVLAPRSPFISFIKRDAPYNLYFLAPAEAFWMYMKVSFLAGLSVTLPLVLWQLWKFISPGLLSHERKYAVPFVFVATAMFYIGLGFCFIIILPFAMDFLLGFSENLKPMISVGNYVDFCLKFLIAFALIFELPLVIIMLTRMGVVTPTALARKRKYAVLGAFILAAFLTPTPDAFNQTLMALPIIVLYEGGIMASKLIWRKGKDE